MASIYCGDFGWHNSKDVCASFNEPPGKLKDARVFVACYLDTDYSGSAYVLFARGENLYEVFGCHCSCYGLEDQWSEEDTSVASIKHRLTNGNLNACMGGNGKRVLNAVKRYLSRFVD
jgi:hypothetical protein